ncbi:MAG TPA: outer membrane protein assembly factor BamC [Gallionellaceae bacterium]|nr:outer membrane protein assembly factor BamC [Gallionellaceae bacterium]
MKVSNFSALTLLVFALAACSSTGNEQDKVDYKAAAIRVKPLEVPPDLTAPVGNDRYGIPGTEGVARYSDYSRGRAGGASAVLPEARNVRLMRDGSQRWLVVNNKAENIWPLVKAFWQENGLVIKTDNPEAGILETDWAENRVKKPGNGKRTLFGKLFDSSNPSGERDQYHTRLERSKDGSSTEIYIKHNGLQEVKDTSQDSYLISYKWLPRASDPELEATMLQMLMARLSGASASSGAGDTAQKAPAAAAVQLLTAADGSKRVQLAEPFDKSWRKVSLALDQARLTLEDKDRSRGVFYLRPAKGATPTDGSALQVNLKENAAGCEVTVTDGKGVATPDAQRILETLYPILSRPL